MSKRGCAELLEELSPWMVEHRQLLIRWAIELGLRGLPDPDEAVPESRLAGHHAHPDSFVPPDKIKQRLRSQ
jgi:hypothetical protein